MPQVPYSPIPQATGGQTLPTVSVNAPEGAFGGDIARAISGLGKTVEGVGDAIAERALWLQNLNNQAEARAADAKFITESGKLQAEFNSLEGDRAMKEYPVYQEKLKALRGQIRSGLTTRGSQDMYDGQTLGTLSRAVFNGASHTAAAQKKFVIDSMEAQRTAWREEAATTPMDDAAIERNVVRTRQSVREEGRLRGAPPEAVANNEKAYTSAIYATRIETIAKELPLQGPEELRKLRDRLIEKDFKRVEAVVNNQRDAYGSAKIATDLIAAHTDEDGDLKVPFPELQAKARELAKRFSPDDPAFETKTERALSSEWNQRKYARKQEQYDNRDILNAGILSGNVNNLEQLLADPKLSAAYYALPERDRLKVPAQIDGYIKARDRQYNEQAFTKLMGLRSNDVAEFLDVDATDAKYKLSQSQIRQVQTEQAKVKRQTGNDPRVTKYMGYMRDVAASQMEALGVFSRTTRNKEDYDHLTGAVQSAIDIWKENHKRPPTPEEFKEKIVPFILREQAQSWDDFLKSDRSFWRLWPSKEPIFRQDTSMQEFDLFKADWTKRTKDKYGFDPSEHEIYKAYVKHQLLKLYPKKGAGEGGNGGK